MRPLRPFGEIAFFALRVVAGFLFALHGAQKLFGVLESDPEPVMSLRWFAGIIEFFGGLMIALGIYTAPVAFIASGEMASAYFISHAPRGFWPILNRGELAALYCFLFLYMATRGGGRWSLTKD